MIRWKVLYRREDEAMQEFLNARGQPATEDEIRLAGADARQLAEQSPVIRTGLALEIAAQQLSWAAQKLLHDEMTAGWEVQEQNLVQWTLTLSARARAGQNCTHKTLLHTLIESVVPAIDAICRMSEEVTNVANAASAETVCGTVDDGPTGVGEILCGSEGGRPLDGPGEDSVGHGEEAERARGGGTVAAIGCDDV